MYEDTTSAFPGVEGLFVEGVFRSLCALASGITGPPNQGLAARTETEVSPEVHDETKKKKEREQKRLFHSG